MKKLFGLFVMICCASVFAAPPAAPEEKAPQKQDAKRGHSPLQRYIWRAFAELSDAERKEMMLLQRNDPEKFREVMAQKARAILEAEKAEKEKMASLVNAFKSAKSDAEKELIKKQISVIVTRRFHQRLASNRRQLEAMKRRAEKLEKELDKRSNNADKIITVIVDDILSGKKPPRGDRHPGHFSGFRRPKPAAK